MKLSTIKQRKEELEKLVSSNELDTATRKLMDFVDDFSANREKRKETINIKAKFNDIRAESRQHGSNEKLESRFINLRAQILDLIYEIEDEFNPNIVYKDNLESYAIAEELQEEIPLNKFEQAREKFKQNRQSFKSTKPIIDNKDVVFRGNLLTKIYKKSSINFSLKPIDIELKYREITALVGENGQGKTTILNMIAGELLHSSGEASYPELSETTTLDDYAYIKTKIAYITQELPKWRGLLKDTLHYTLSEQGVLGKENEEEVDFIIHRLSLEKYADATWKQISGGYKMRFSLAKAILQKPKLLILDEPLANLDINTQNLFLTDLRDIANSLKNPISIIISSQNLYEVEGIADNIIFMSDGKALYNGTMDKFGEDRIENTFEVNLGVSKEKLLTVLDDIDYLSVDRDGKNYLINTKIEVTDKILLDCFLKQGLSVKYFRNISKSTRKLFGRL